MTQSKHATQMDLFSQVLHAYSAENRHALDNATLYETVAERTGLPPDALSKKEPVGSSGQPHNLLTRKIRWYQHNREYICIDAQPYAAILWTFSKIRGLYA